MMMTMTPVHRAPHHLLWTFLAASLLSIRSVGLFWTIAGDAIFDDNGIAGNGNNNNKNKMGFGRMLLDASATMPYPAASSTAYLRHDHHLTATATTTSSSVSPSVTVTQQNVHNPDDGTTRGGRPPKVLLYITTLFSDQHVGYFDCCWPALMEDSLLLPNVDVQVFSNNETRLPDEYVDRVTALFRNNPSFRFRFPTRGDLRSVKQQSQGRRKASAHIGANLGLQLGFREGWFDGYDWLIRINPDVLIRNSTWIVRQLHDPTADGIFVDCGDNRSYLNRTTKFHTDFFAVRPGVLMEEYRRHVGYYPTDDPASPIPTIITTVSDTNSSTNNNSGNAPSNHHRQQQQKQHRQLLPFGTMVREVMGEGGRGRYGNTLVGVPNHEMTAYRYFTPIVEAGRHRYLPDVGPSEGRCRVKGGQAPVYHGHGDGGDTACSSGPERRGNGRGNAGRKRTCAALEGWTIT
jgi:hypothetical protein